MAFTNVPQTFIRRCFQKIRKNFITHFLRCRHPPSSRDRAVNFTFAVSNRIMQYRLPSRHIHLPYNVIEKQSWYHDDVAWSSRSFPLPPTPSYSSFRLVCTTRNHPDLDNIFFIKYCKHFTYFGNSHNIIPIFNINGEVLEILYHDIFDNFNLFDKTQVVSCLDFVEHSNDLANEVFELICTDTRKVEESKIVRLKSLRRMMCSLTLLPVKLTKIRHPFQSVTVFRQQRAYLQAQKNRAASGCFQFISVPITHVRDFAGDRGKSASK